jgi:hypothetical protein
VKRDVLLASIAALAVTAGASGAWTAHRALDRIVFFQNEAVKLHKEAKTLKAHLSVARGQLADAERRIAEMRGKPPAVRAGRPGTLSFKANSWMNVKTPNKSARYWKGQAGLDEHGHAIWEAPEYSLRAGALTLRSYYVKHGIKTVRGIVERYSTKNHKEYAEYVAKRMGVSPDEEIDVIRRMPELLRWMAQFETGKPVPERMLCTLDILSKI